MHVRQTAREDMVPQLCSCLLTITHQQHLTYLKLPVLQLLQQEPRFVLQHLATDADNPRIAAFLVAFVGGCVK